MPRSTATLNKGQLEIFKGMFLIATNRRPSEMQIRKLLAKDYVLQNGDDLTLTETGKDELGRLAFFSGLSVGREQSN